MTDEPIRANDSAPDASAMARKEDVAGETPPRDDGNTETPDFPPGVKSNAHMAYVAPPGPLGSGNADVLAATSGYAAPPFALINTPPPAPPVQSPASDQQPSDTVDLQAGLSVGARGGVTITQQEEPPEPAVSWAKGGAGFDSARFDSSAFDDGGDPDPVIQDEIRESENTAPIAVFALPDVPGIESIPRQVATASQFSVDVSGRLDLVPDPPYPDALQRELYQEMRHKAIELSTLGHNQLGDLAEPVRRFLLAAPERFEDGSLTRLWSRGNTLRRRLKAHDTALASSDNTDPALLPTLVAETVHDLVDTYNVFIVGDPKGRELDQIRLGPQDRDAARATIDRAVLIVEAVKVAEGVATAGAVEALTEQVGAARDAPAAVDGDQATDLARKTTANFVSELLRLGYGIIRRASETAWKEARSGFYRAAGTAAFGTAVWYREEILRFIVDNAENLKAFVEQAFHNPTLIRIIDLIAGF